MWITRPPPGARRESERPTSLADDRAIAMAGAAPESEPTELPRVVLLAALWLSLALAWANFLTTGRWAGEPGALHGWRAPYYALALGAATVFAVRDRRRVGSPATLGQVPSLTLLAVGASVLVASLFVCLPPSTWTQIPFKDDWTELFQQAVNGVALLRRGVVVGWNWWFLGGYPTSTDIAQNVGTAAFLPMLLFGDRVGYHVLHAVLFLTVPVVVWWDLAQEHRRVAVLSAAFACFLSVGYFGRIASSGDTNSLVGVCAAAAALAGSRAARLGRWWGTAALLLALTLALYTHAAFFVYAVLYLGLESAYFRDRSSAVRLAVACAFAGAAALPAHWESFRYPEYVSFNNTVYDPHAPIDWPLAARTILYNLEILALPHRWFNDYRSLANIWLPVLVALAAAPRRTRTGFYACAAVLTQLLLRVNTSEVGAMFDRIQHMLPLLVAPGLAGFVLRWSGTRRLAISLAVLIALYVQTPFTTVRHVPELRAFDPPLIDRIAASEGMVLVEVSPHRDMDSDPHRRSPTTPFDVHFEGLLPRVAGQRFYSQMIDGWVWNRFRGQVVGAGTYRGRPVGETAPDDFAREMRRWGVAHLFVWTDAAREYLRTGGRFVERWRGGRWSEFEVADADIRSVLTPAGSGRLTNLDFLGADVELHDVRAGDVVTVRANYYPAWRARLEEGGGVPLYAVDGQLAFIAPRTGSYTVVLEYPRYTWLSVLALSALAAGLFVLSRWPSARGGRT